MAMAKRRSENHVVTAGDLAAAIACAKLEVLELCSSDSEKKYVEMMAERVKCWLEDVCEVKLPVNIKAQRYE
jgi:hypothetical protein